MLFSLSICIQTQHLGLLTFENPQKVFMWKQCSHLPRWSGLSAVMGYLTKDSHFQVSRRLPSLMNTIIYHSSFLSLCVSLLTIMLILCLLLIWLLLIFSPCQIDSFLPASSIFWRNRGDGCNLWQPVLDKNCYNLFIFLMFLPAGILSWSFCHLQDSACSMTCSSVLF